MITIENVSKKFGGKTVLQSLSLALEEKKVHVLIGSSGSGKTTLLKILAGILAPDEGQVRLFHNLLSQKASSQLEQDFFLSYGYVIQNGGLFPHLTAKKNCLLAVYNHNLGAEEEQKRLDWLVELVQLDPELLDKFPRQLSGGQQQRVGIIRALMNRPKFLLFDEPLGALDPLVRSELQQDLEVIFEKLQTTVFFVTHDMNEAAFFGDTITLLHEGRMVQHGVLQDLVKNPSDPFVTRFIQSQTAHALLAEIHS